MIKQPRINSSKKYQRKFYHPWEFFYNGFNIPTDDKTATDKFSKNISGGHIIRGDFYPTNFIIPADDKTATDKFSIKYQRKSYHPWEFSSNKF